MSLEPLKIEFRANEGYGDFVTGLCYAHAATIKYNRPVSINFHWPNKRETLFSSKDSESIYERFECVLSRLKPADNLSIIHSFESYPPFRFINNLDHNNPLHGFWYLKEVPKVKYGYIAVWTSKYNIEFPGYHKDPLYDYWDKIIDNLEKKGYTVKEITYRTPVDQVLDIISCCEFGIGYEGMLHQLFKFTWRPIIVGAKRLKLTNFLVPQAQVLSSFEEFTSKSLSYYLLSSELKTKYIKNKYNSWLYKSENSFLHPLYNKEVY